MTTHPYIPLYVDDFEAATTHLSLEEDGAYNRLLRLCWRTPGCSLPNDPEWIARKIRLSAADYERVAAPVLAEFFKLIRGRFVQRRLKAEYENISRKKLSRKQAGKKGGEAKARNAKENPASNATDLLPHTRAFHNHTHNQIEPNGSIPSEPKGSAGPALVVDYDADAWRGAVTLLTERGGVDDGGARRFFGKLISTHRLEARDLLSPVSSALVNGTRDPQGYLTKAAQAVSKRREDSKPRRVGFV